jgi:hypothetical protein
MLFSIFSTEKATSCNQPATSATREEQENKTNKQMEEKEEEEGKKKHRKEIAIVLSSKDCIFIQ